MKKNRQTLGIGWTAGVFVATLCCTSAFHYSAMQQQQRNLQVRTATTRLALSSKSWSVVDDWNQLSSENPHNNNIFDNNNDNDDDSTEGTPFFSNKELAQMAAWKMELAASRNGDDSPPSPEDDFLNQMIDTIQTSQEDHGEETDDADADVTVLRDAAQKVVSSSSSNSNSFVDAMEDEIALLIRCNEEPEQLLIRQGRALPPLTEAERFHVGQLVQPSPTGFQPTPFFEESIEVMFMEHAGLQQQQNQDDQPVWFMDAASVASWMQTSLKNNVGKHDARVTSVVSLYSEYGSGRLALEGFQRLYMDAIVGTTTATTVGDGKADNAATAIAFLNKLKRYRAEEVQAVWRDLANHGIVSPVLIERQQLEQEILTELQQQHTLNSDGTFTTTMQGRAIDMLFDECEILDEGVVAAGSKFMSTRKNNKSNQMSHQSVELADDAETPIWIKDGEFVFIDEESCIGCTQCVLAAPASFKMTPYDGRARTFMQHNSPDVAIAVNACPVDCMHFVSFRELKEFETAREFGDGREDHRHFGQNKERGFMGLTPLHVAGRDSDANHRSSWYHYLRNKCQSSKRCPDRGCFDCPNASKPGANPHFQERLKKATHVRAQYFIDHGHSDVFRKTAEL